MRRFIKMSRKLIVNADDFGHSSSRNRAIVESFQNNLITQTTLMVNMPGTDEAVKLAFANGFSNQVGLHLNLTEGFPMMDLVRSCPRICREDGAFRRDYPFMGLPYCGKERLALEKELSAQIERYKSFDLPLMHCDGHHHIQSRIPLSIIIFPLLRAAGFKTFRNCYPCPKYDIDRRFLRMSRYTPAYWLVRKLTGSGVLRCADYFMDFKVCRRCSDRIPDGVVSELMVHPRYDEKGMLVDFHAPMAEVGRIVRGIGFELVDYSAVLSERLNHG